MARQTRVRAAARRQAASVDPGGRGQVGPAAPPPCLETVEPNGTEDLVLALLPVAEHGEIRVNGAEEGEPVRPEPGRSEPGGTGEPAPRLQRHVDGFDTGGVWGWISDPEDRGRRFVVVLRSAGRIQSRAMASQFRKDVLAAGVGDGCYAFTLPIPDALRDGRTHWLEVTEERSGLPLAQPMRWRHGPDLNGRGDVPAGQADGPYAAWPVHGGQALASGPRARPGGAADPAITVRLVFDISDLVYYLGRHPNLSGIQRVQSGIVIAMLNGARAAHQDVVFLSFSMRSRQWTAIPAGFLGSLLQDLFLPQEQRLVWYSMADAEAGELPGCHAFDGVGVLDDGVDSVFCLLGAAWGQPDYFRRALNLKRRFGTRLVVMVHDLIPIYAGHTCDRGTVLVFEDFLWRSLHHVDHYLTVSESTARDLARYAASVGLALPGVTVTGNGSSFDEFLPSGLTVPPRSMERIPERFVLFVSTVEGRKNHVLMLDVWRRMVTMGDDPPHLVCVGRVGWRSERFLSGLVETDYVDGRVVILQDISDAMLGMLYERCLFTVYPSLYEGWGLPIGESLAAGKVCVCSDRTSLPEVAGDCGVYIDIDDPGGSCQTIRRLIMDGAERSRLEARIRETFRPVTWDQMTRRVTQACEAAAPAAWAAPYPVAAVPYATEISFAQLTRTFNDTPGEEVLRQSGEVRRGMLLDATLREQQFLTGEEVRTEGAWAQPETWGTWLCDGPGEIMMGLPPSGSGVMHVFLRLRASEGASAVHVRLLADGDLVWQGAIGGQSRTLPLRIVRRSAGLEPGWWPMRLRAEAHLSPGERAAISAIDARVPIIGFERLLVVPNEDLSTRLDVLTNLLR